MTLLLEIGFCNVGINFQFTRKNKTAKPASKHYLGSYQRTIYDICKYFLVLTENKLHFQSVTLSDEVAKKRKVQKTILERKGPPTFTCAVEMISKTEYRVHRRLDVTVDNILAGNYDRQITSFSYISRCIIIVADPRILMVSFLW
jgi:tRNA/tmRNA/rRNA uracil-C5-methylase (TrmA/RlmC/RlmD family)